MNLAVPQAATGGSRLAAEEYARRCIVELMSANNFGLPQLPYYLEMVDKKLKESTSASSSVLQAAVSRFISAKGKRLRPSLVIAIATCGGNEVDDKVLSAAAAIELLHIGSLVHDDIMDESLIRWGIPTISSKEGVNTAILAGDYFLAKASALASSVSAEAGMLVTETIAKMCEGQSLELTDRFNLDRSVKSLMQAIKGKTAALFSAACQLGGLLAGLSKAQVAALAAYGENFGLAYQLMDDVLDFTKTPQSTGKSVGGDAREGNYTLPVLFSLQGQQKEKLKKLLQGRNVSNAEVLEILLRDGSIDQTVNEAKKYSGQACLKLNHLNIKDIAVVLERFARMV